MKVSQKMLLCAAVMGAASQAPAWAHAALESSTPSKDAALDRVPQSVTLHFNEKLEPAFSSIHVIDTSGHDVSKEKAALDPADPKVLKVNLETLKPGAYTVKWAAVGQDGHLRKGEYTFSVK